MSDRLKYTEGLVWPIDSDFKFPEHAIDTYDGKRDFGVCVSGGGTRAASLTAGQLRALQTNGILDKAGYLSCVSGGAWASVPFTYLDSGISDSTYLGVTPPMEELTLDNLEQTEKYSLAKAASDAGLFDDFLRNLFAGDERFSQMIGGVFLKPFNIDSESRFFSLDTPSVLKILDQNSQDAGNRFIHGKPERLSSLSHCWRDDSPARLQTLPIRNDSAVCRNVCLP
jgi:hypothetical protein